MSKKGQQQQRVPEKHKGKSDYQFSNSKKTSKNQSVNSFDQLEPNEADQTEFLSLLPSDYPLGEHDTQDNQILQLIAEKILADYKHLLTLEKKKFWSTIKHNLSLQDSLDLFLRFAPRQHLAVGLEHKYVGGKYWIVIQEIYRSVLGIYLRMVSFNIEDQEGLQTKAWKCTDVIYDCWLIDVMKMTDIAQIYGATNQPLVDRIISSVFNIQPLYIKDFQATYKTFIDKVINRLYQTLSQHSNQSNLDAEIFSEDLKNRMETLTLILDSVQNMITWTTYFPKKIKQEVFSNVQGISSLEQIYYELLMARGFTRGNDKFPSYWRIDKYPKRIDSLIERILFDILKFFKNYYEHLLDITLQEIDERTKKQQISEHITYIIQNFGLVRRKGTSSKKNQSKNEIKEWWLLEGLFDQGFSIPEFLENYVPWEILNQIDKTEKNDLIELMKAQLEAREFLKQIESGAKKFEEEKLLELDDIEAFNPEESKLEQLEKESKEKEEQIQQQVEEDQAFMAEKEEKLTQIVSKRQQVATLELPQDKKDEMAQMMMRMYEDEPDDTYEHDYPRKLQNQDQESDDDHTGNKKVLKRQEYDRSQQYEDDSEPRPYRPQQKRNFQNNQSGNQIQRNQTYSNPQNQNIKSEQQDDYEEEEGSQSQILGGIRGGNQGRGNYKGSRGSHNKGDRRGNDRGGHEDRRRNDGGPYNNDKRGNQNRGFDQGGRGDNSNRGRKNNNNTQTMYEPKQDRGYDDEVNDDRRQDDRRQDDRRQDDRRQDDRRQDDKQPPQRKYPDSMEQESRQDGRNDNRGYGKQRDNRGNKNNNYRQKDDDYSRREDNRGGYSKKYEDSDSGGEYSNSKQQNIPVLSRKNKDGAYVNNVYQEKKEKKQQK